jgi:hypothetical protein
MHKHTDSIRFLWKAVPFLVAGLCFAIFSEIVHQVGAASPAQNPRAGICHVNDLDTGANGTRYDRAVNAGANWTRWPLYWDQIEPDGDGVFNWTAADAVFDGDRTHHNLYTDAILMGRPAPYWRAGPEMIAGLWEPIFADGSHDGAPGAQKPINPNNPWARFVHHCSLAIRYSYIR